MRSSQVENKMEKNMLNETLNKMISSEAIISLLSKIGMSLLIVVIGFVILRVVDRIAQKLLYQLIDIRLLTASSEQAQRAEIRRQTLSSIAHHALIIAGYVTIFLMALSSLGLDITPLLAGAGVASLAIGFGAQNLVKDVISGFFIILEDQYGRGDIVNLDGDTGTVEQISLRTTQLRNAEGVLIVRSNGSINVVRNMTKEWSTLDFKIGVAYSSDINKVFQVVLEEAKALRNEAFDKVLEEPKLLGLESFNESDITIRLQMKVQPGQQWPLKRLLNKKIKERFDREAIEIPFPQRVIWQGKDSSC